ncbi:hypothetical protein ABH930_006711 [Kitasatospora sp. GAS204A]|nr:hypothetical protein [Kitasatospora sp. GAS204B]
MRDRLEAERTRWINQIGTAARELVDSLLPLLMDLWAGRP